MPLAEMSATPSAEHDSDGAAEQAPQQYWRAAGVESEPVLRANALVAKARVSLSRGEIPAAADDLEQALAAAPAHPGALVLLAEISYRKQEWHRARELYTALERVPDVAEVVPREQIVQRRAALAQRLGDTAEAEALYRELAILSPRHVEARRVLAELALARGDTATAALRLEELLRLLPAGSSPISAICATGWARSTPRRASGTAPATTWSWSSTRIPAACPPWSCCCRPTRSSTCITRPRRPAAGWRASIPIARIAPPFCIARRRSAATSWATSRAPSTPISAPRTPIRTLFRRASASSIIFGRRGTSTSSPIWRAT